MLTLVRRLKWPLLALAPPHALGGQQDQARDDERDGDERELLGGVVEHVFEDQPADADRNGADDQVPAHPVLE